MAGKLLRRFATAGVIMAAAFSVTTGVASANKPVGGCPNSTWSILPTNSSDSSSDHNGNGMVCVKLIPAFPGNNIVDDNSHSN